MNKEAFLSEDEETLYFILEDTSYTPRRPDTDKILYFSILNNEIVGARDLLEIGRGDATGHILYKGRRGISIVESFYGFPSVDSYYDLYNFDQDSPIDGHIYQVGRFEPFFAGNADYLIIAEEKDSAYYSYYSGVFNFYNSKSGTLVKTLTLPPGGTIYTFDNYPFDIYYVLNLETEPEIYNLTKVKLNSISPGLTFTPSVYSIPNGGSTPFEFPSFTVSLTGEFFTDSAVVYFNGLPKETIFYSDSLITFQLDSTDIYNTGNYPVYVKQYNSFSDTLIFTVVDSLPEALEPIIECINYEEGPEPEVGYTAYYGYSNSNNAAVYVPVSNKNMFGEGYAIEYMDRGQPVLFLPGANNYVFSVQYPGNEPPYITFDGLIWTLSNFSVAIDEKETPPCE
jgi:hypothetical protein